MTATAVRCAVPGAGARPVVCADIGSTFTKVAVVDTAGGALLATAEHPTTAGTDVLHGLDAAVAAAAGLLPGVPLGEPLVCSSAGGGLRLAVVGYEELVTARAGRLVGLSAGARVVHVGAGRLDAAGVAALRAARPDVVLLVGGTDGGDAEVLVHNAGRLARLRPAVPVVAAGNAQARGAVAAALAPARVPAVVCANVLPAIGVLEPAPARAAIRAVFLRHVIGGKRLSRGPRLGRLVRGATPDLVLAGVELLAGAVDGDLLVVDVGGATTDVYSALVPDPQREAGPLRPAAGVLWRGRTVEGDLGVRAGADGVVAAAAAEGLLGPDEQDGLAAAAAARVARPDLVPADAVAQAVDLRLSELAVTVSLRRHVRAGTDLRRVALVVGSGGVLRHAGPDRARAVLAAAVSDTAGGWALPRAPAGTVDVHYVLAAAGLLGPGYPRAAAELVRGQLLRAVPLAR